MVIVSGQAGTGKTKLVQHLFRLSSIFQNTFNSSASSSSYQQQQIQAPSPSLLKTSHYYSSNAQQTTTSSASSLDTTSNLITTTSCSSNNNYSPTNYAATSTNIQVKYLASNLAGVHVCLREDKRTREPGQFLHNLVWSLTHFDCLHKIVLKSNNSSSSHPLNDSNSDKYVHSTQVPFGSSSVSYRYICQ